jgi:hypothetical protein
MLEARQETDKHAGEERKIRKRGVESVLRDWGPSGGEAVSGMQ